MLEIKNLSIAAGTKEIISDISLTLEKGRVLGLIGESGAGKSTIALAAIGFLSPGLAFTSGQVHLFGENLVNADPKMLRSLRRNKVAYVAQSAAAAFNPFYRLADQVTELKALQESMTRSDRRKLASELFEQLQLPEPDIFCRKYPHQASGGQLQRAMIAMALLNNPELIVFDEPTTALDVTVQVEVLRVIKDVIAKQGCAAIYVSHDLAVVSQMCDDILVLRNGKMVELNEARLLIDNPKAEYTQALVSHRKDGDFIDDKDKQETILSVKSLGVGYGKVKIVEDINIKVDKAQIVALVGESGSGKTTVARSIAGLLEPWEGAITLNGNELPASIDQRSDIDRRRVQFVHQLPDVALNPRQTIRLAIARPLQKFYQLSGRKLDDRLNQLMDEVELSHTLLDRYPGSLSGGQKQRVCIARCLAAEPDMLICDEVTSALDPLVEDSILKLLWDLKLKKQLSILFITHNLGVTRRFAHSVVIMERGRIVEQGETTKVFENPKMDYSKKLLAARPSMEAGWLEKQFAL